MQLSKRLLAVSEMVTSNSCLADIGTDHGYIPIYLKEKGQIQTAIAMDVNQGPLQRARENINAFGLTSYIETRLSDGAGSLSPKEADSAVIAGMGGALTIKILAEGRKVFSVMEELILQPQSEIWLVREYLEENGFQIVEENMVLEDGKYYPMMRVVPGSMKLEGRVEYKYGPLLLRDKQECLLSFLNREAHMYETIKADLQLQSGEKARNRIEEVEQELKWIREAKEYYR